MDLDDLAIVPNSDIDSEGLDNLHAEHTASHKRSVQVVGEASAGDRPSTILEPPSSPPSASSASQTPSSPFADSRPARRTMPFSSSPVLYPASSSPPQQQPKKRKLFQKLDSEPLQKRPKIVGPFVDDDEDEPPEQNTAHATVSNPGQSAENVASMVEAAIDIDDVLPNESQQHESPRPSIIPAQPMLRRRADAGHEMITTSGATFRIPIRSEHIRKTYEETLAQRSAAAAGRAKRSYYGIEIQKLMHDAKIQRELDQAQAEFEKQEQEREADLGPHATDSEANLNSSKKNNDHLMWTEKYRAKRFTDLVGDERTHRQVLRWLKAWDDIVFPGNARSRSKHVFEDKNAEGERQHRKILLLTGPPGLGKTTLAHVCAKKAGYEPLEINASDERSRDVVKGRIKDALGTENVRGIKEAGKDRKAGKPVCVIIDEVDGVVTGSGGTGEGGFMKALVDLIHLDQHNASAARDPSSENGRKKKGDKFRMLRPIILVCNDVYAPSMRPLRSSGLAEIVYVRKPALDKVITRLRSVFDSENVPCDNDAVRRICEGAWGMGTRKQNSLGGQGAGEGDLRGILVQAEWMAHKFRAKENGGSATTTRLTRKWVDSQLGQSQSASGQKGLGRGGTREVLDRLFVEGAGLPNLPTAMSAEDARMLAESQTKPIGVADIRKRAAISALHQMIDTCGEHERLMTECFTVYPTGVFQDDTQLSKPNAAYDWLHFHDTLSYKLYGGQEWELAPYLSTGACAFHHLFATVDKGNKNWNDERKDEEEVATHPFSGSRADYAAHEAQKENKTILTELQSSFSAPLLRLFSSIDNMATELIPSVNRMLAPDVKPVVIGGSGGSRSVASVRKESEKSCIQTAVRVMNGLELRFDQVKVELDTAAGPAGRAGFVYRMEPPLDTLTAFHLDNSSRTTAPVPTRYAVRQVLEQELLKEKMLQSSTLRQNRSTALGNHAGDGADDKENQDPQSVPTVKVPEVKRDFFGREVKGERPSSASTEVKKQANSKVKEEDRVWVSFHEGFSNAVRKPITLRELMDGF